MTGTVRNRSSRNLAAGSFQPVINSFALHLRAEGKSPKTVRTYVEAAGWFAAEHLRKRTDCVSWEDVARSEVEGWMAWLLERYSDTYATSKWLWLGINNRPPMTCVGTGPARAASGRGVRTTASWTTPER